jgi:16S rRNA C967 or C1407 C5-methylase (RsmB/RsmF family)/NOL1/NOP2/fmu family ribosome biogenesis protein
MAVNALPEKLLKSLQGLPGFDKEEFVNVHNSKEQITSIRFNPSKELYQEPFENSNRVPWSTHGHYLQQRPFFTFDPFLHGGAYYVQEASSMFLEQAINQTIDLSQPLKVLDLCSAPGGKSTLIQSLISEDSLVVCNEVIKSRANIVDENLTKWGGANVVLTNNDPRDFSRLEGFFDMIVVDAPCSGSGLFRRDADAISEWSEQNVAHCSHRQQRILSDVYPALKKDGILIYSTCSYSKEENEEISDWLMDNFQVINLPLLLDSDWGVVSTISKKKQAQGYRFYPHKVKGEGFFISCFKKMDGRVDKIKAPRKTGLQNVSKQEAGIISPWLKENVPVELWKNGEMIFAFPSLFHDMLQLLADNLYLRKAGIGIGKIAGKELIPDHSLALSGIVSNKIVGLSLKLPDALQYLRKEEVRSESSSRGWAIVLYEDIRLGWVKILPNRINNYYPKEWRILKSENN